MKTIHLLFLTSLVLFTYSCEKDTNEIEKTATITINSPTASTVIGLGDTLKINGSINANFEIHGYTLLIYPYNNQANKILERNNHTHGEIIPFNEEWINTSVSDQELILEVVAHLTHSGDQDQRSTVQFVVN